MSQRIASDHPTVETVDVTLGSHGPTGRPRVELPGDAPIPVDEVVFLSLAGRNGHARVRETVGGDRQIRGVYDTPAQARRDDDGPNRLVEWASASDLDAGRTIHLDVLDAGRAYGIRGPGERAVYDVPEEPDESLAGIAERLDGD